MDVNVTNLSAQLDSIVQGSAPEQAPPKETQASKIEDQKVVPQEVQLYHKAKEAGQEEQFLTDLASAMNDSFKSFDIDDVSHKVIINDGHFYVQVVGKNGEVVKTIPGEGFVETRANIKEALKGWIEDTRK